MQAIVALPDGTEKEMSVNDIMERAMTRQFEGGVISHAGDPGMTAQLVGRLVVALAESASLTAEEINRVADIADLEVLRLVV